MIYAAYVRLYVAGIAILTKFQTEENETTQTYLFIDSQPRLGMAE